MNLASYLHRCSYQVSFLSTLPLNWIVKITCWDFFNILAAIANWKNYILIWNVAITLNGISIGIVLVKHSALQEEWCYLLLDTLIYTTFLIFLHEYCSIVTAKLRGVWSFQSMALIFFANCDKLVEYGKQFSSMNWSRIALLPCLDDTQFYWEQLFEISEFYRLLQFQISCHHCCWCILVTDFVFFHIFSRGEVAVYDATDITT